MGLTERDRAILEFEQGWRHLPGPEAAAIAEKLRLSPTRHYAVLDALLDDPRRWRPTRCWSGGCGAASGGGFGPRARAGVDDP